MADKKLRGNGKAETVGNRPVEDGLSMSKKRRNEQLCFYPIKVLPINSIQLCSIRMPNYGWGLDENGKEAQKLGEKKMRGVAHNENVRMRSGGRWSWMVEGEVLRSLTRIASVILYLAVIIFHSKIFE